MKTEKPEKDIPALLELLKMKPSNGHTLKLARFRRATYSAVIKPYLKCGRKPADAQASGRVNFRTG